MVNECPFCKNYNNGSCLRFHTLENNSGSNKTCFQIKNLSAAEFLDLAELYAEKDNNQKVIREIKTARKLMLAPLIGKKIRKMMQKEADKYVAEQRKKKGTNA